MHSLKENVENFMSLFALAFKVCLVLGGACISIYSLRIGHFPQGLSTGDAILFLLAAGSFWFFYSAFAGSLLALGIVLSPIIRFILKLLGSAPRLWRKKAMVPRYTLAAFKWPALPPAMLAIFFIAALTDGNAAACITLIIIAVLLYFGYSACLDMASKAQAINFARKSKIITDDKNENDAAEQDRLKQGRMLITTICLLIPLLVGGVSGKLLDAAMRLAHIRVENATIYLAEPYSALIPKANIPDRSNAPTGYVEFDRVLLPLKGIGTSTLISFAFNGRMRTLEVPDNKVIVLE